MKKLIAVFMMGLFIAFNTIATNATEVKSTVANSTASFAKELKDSIVNDVKTTVATSVNTIKLNNYKTQLETKKKELSELENSSTNVFIKYFKTMYLNQKISELESNIKTLEESETKE